MEREIPGLSLEPLDCFIDVEERLIAGTPGIQFVPFPVNVGCRNMEVRTEDDVVKQREILYYRLSVRLYPPLPTRQTAGKKPRPPRAGAIFRRAFLQAARSLILFSPMSTAAALLLPPPRPEPGGIFFFIDIATPVSRRLSLRNISAAFQARLSFPWGSLFRLS